MVIKFESYKVSDIWKVLNYEDGILRTFTKDMLKFLKLFLKFKMTKVNFSRNAFIFHINYKEQTFLEITHIDFDRLEILRRQQPRWSELDDVKFSVSIFNLNRNLMSKTHRQIRDNTGDLSDYLNDVFNKHCQIMDEHDRNYQAKYYFNRDKYDLILSELTKDKYDLYSESKKYNL